MNETEKLSDDVLSFEDAVQLAIQMRDNVLSGVIVHPISIERLCCAMIKHAEATIQSAQPASEQKPSLEQIIERINSTIIVESESCEGFRMAITARIKDMYKPTFQTTTPDRVAGLVAALEKISSLHNYLPCDVVEIADAALAAVKEQ